MASTGFRLFAAPTSRRDVLRGLTTLTPVLARVLAEPAEAGNRRRAPQLNELGCVDVGKACRGKDELCCSGICQGRKPKRGKRDRSKCIAHNTGGCLPGQEAVATPCGTGGFCATTTGNAGFCYMPATGRCTNCRKDVECETVLGPGSACVVNGFACPGQPAVCLRPAA